MDDALRAVARLRHSHPHQVLGLHFGPSGGVLRVFRPDARRVSALCDGATIPLHPSREGFFEARMPPARQRYQLEAEIPGQTERYFDAYAFPPTLGEDDLHFLGEGRHRRLWERLGAHRLVLEGVEGTAFAVWAPNADGVSVVGDFNRWDGRIHQLRSLGSSGIWEIFIPGVSSGQKYKFEVRGRGQPTQLKADPFAFATELPPKTASVVTERSAFQWTDSAWLKKRTTWDRVSSPMSIYEVHPASFRRVPEDNSRSLSYRELAHWLAETASSLGMTHVELTPIAEHPFGGSWGYQVSSYFAPTARFGTPDDFRYLVNALHERGIGVIIDWVPAHFPRDEWALARFDGTELYEHADPRRGAHPDWGTLIFNYGRNEVRNFLIANALFWVNEFHIDGLRVDAVASMLYLDYSRAADEWVPNRFGGRENEEAIGFLKELNVTMRELHPDVMVIAEESTSWPGVSREVEHGGLGFTGKWNMGWMHDTLSYFQKDPVHRKYHHHQLTFGLLYAWSERFILPLSHDEVVHGKRSLLSKMPGDDWQKFANLRALYGWMWAHPGKKLLFMGGELGQWREWNHDSSVDWHLLSDPKHQQVQHLVSKINQVYRAEGSLYELDHTSNGFQWVQADAADNNVFAFIRRGRNAWREILCIANLSPVVRQEYRVGVPAGGLWAEILNTDAAEFGGSNVRNAPVKAERRPWDGQPASIAITLPPLSVVWLGLVDPP